MANFMDALNQIRGGALNQGALNQYKNPNSALNFSETGIKEATEQFMNRDNYVSNMPTEDPNAARQERMINAYSQPVYLDDDAIDRAAIQYVDTGKMITLGRGEAAAINRAKIIGRAADIQYDPTADAEEFINSGKMRSFGRGEDATIKRTKIYNKANELLTERGINPSEIPALRRENDAATSSLKQLLKQYKMVSAFETNAYLNADLAKEANAMGSNDPEIKKSAQNSFVNEYAKIMSGSMGNTPVSDSMREHAHEMLNLARKKGQYDEVIDILKQDIDNRMKGFDDEINSLLPKPIQYGRGAEAAKDRIRAMRK